MFNDLREFVKKAEDLGEFKLIEGADVDLEIGAITHLLGLNPNPPLLMFDKIKGYGSGYRVASNLFASARRTALGYGLPLEAKGIELVRALRDKISAGIKYMPPVQVATGPVKENVLVGADVDLLKFPAPKWHELDGGRYIGTGTMTIMRDPDEGWLNVGVYRTQIHDKTTATVQITETHHGDVIQRKYWSKGLPCPAAVACGQDPMLWAAATWPLPWGASEYDFAGGFRGAPVEVTRGVTTDLPIPASAEIVLEGEVVPPEVESRTEGPFGEWCGYYAAGATQRPAFRVKSILHRNNPIIQGNPPSRFPAVWSLGVHIHRAAGVWSELDRQVPGVRGVWIPEDSTSNGLLVISLKQEYAGHAKQAAMVAAGAKTSSRLFRFIIVVDEDIDPSNMSEVLWALGTRVDPETSIDVLRGAVSNVADPMLSPDKRKQGDTTRSVAITIACKPYHWMKDFPPSIETSPELTRQIKSKWKELFAS